MTGLRSFDFAQAWVGMLVMLSLVMGHPGAAAAPRDERPSTDQEESAFRSFMKGSGIYSEQDYLQPGDWDEPSRWTVLQKLGRGLSNTVTGWLEIPMRLQQRYRPDDPVTSICTASLMGIARGVARTGVGLFETVTFLVAIPEDYQPILPPLGYFQGRGTRQPTY